MRRTLLLPGSYKNNKDLLGEMLINGASIIRDVTIKTNDSQTHSKVKFGK
jgi:hypothetical protein